VYNPATGAFTATGSLTTARYYHTATLLNNGMVLVAGGSIDAYPYVSPRAELYNPATGTFTIAGSLNTGRYLHTATLLDNGMVLMAGGFDANGNSLFSAQLYNPAAGTFTTTGSLNAARGAHTATLLNNGTVLMASGYNSSSNTDLVSAEVYDPGAGTFTFTGNLNTARDTHTATLLNSGLVLIAGGENSSEVTLASAELFQPATLTPPNLVSISLAPSSPTVPLETALRFIATGTFSEGSTEQLAEVTWSSSNPGVISISDDASNPGAAYAAVAGTATVSACAGAVCGSTTVTVGPPLVTISVTPADGTVPPGSSVQFYATGTSTDGSTRDLTSSVAWSSSAPGVATIDGGGLATGLSVGSTTIEAALGTIDGSTTLTVTTGFVLTGSLNTPRYLHTATLLNNGLVLMAGGNGSGGPTLANAELYNPANGTFTPTGSLNAARESHTATLLNNGMVLIVVGGSSEGLLASAELYNPATGTFTPTGSLNMPRSAHTATLLSNGMVLIAGGTGHSGTLASAELYNPATGTFTYTGSLNWARREHTATLLSNGMVLMAGGDDVNSNPLASAELYNPATGTFTATGGPNTARVYHTATLLNNGLVLLAGGGGSSGVLASAELYNSATGTFTATGSLNAGRELHTATLLNNGMALMAGGSGFSGVLTSAELFEPATLTPLNLVSISLAPSSPTVALGTALRFIATGTFSGGSTEQLAEVTWSSFNPAVISISDDASSPGAAYAAATGVATVSACAGAVCGATTVTVGPRLVSLVVTPASATVAPGLAVQFYATGISSNGSSQDLTSSVTWSSSVLSVATVNAGGLGSALSVGSSTITAASGEVQGSATLVVTTAPILTGSLSTPRYAHTATLLSNGLVLMAGGYNSSGPLASAELYNPASGGSFSTTVSLNNARYGHTATLLNNGLLLIAGGYDSSGYLGSAELYDPVAQTFTPTTGSLNTPRYWHTATLLASGMVLIAGGYDSSGSLASAELYDPTTQTFTPTASLNTARYWHTATPLFNGMVLIVGGHNSSGALASAELYDPASNTFNPIGSLNTARYVHTATLLSNGLVLVAGGYGPGGFLASAEVYNLATGGFTPTGSLNTARDWHAATLLNNGQVLLAGGLGPSGFLASTELYDPMAETFDAGGSLNSARGAPTATLLTNGLVLMAGGLGSSGYFASAELYAPATFTPPELVSIAITPATPTLSPGTTQQFIATGTFSDSSTEQLAAVTWSSSNTSYAQISNDVTNPGLSLALPPGPTVSNTFTVTITAAAGNVSGTATLTVRPTGFVSTGSLNTARDSHTATLLNNGLVLIAGGFGPVGGGSNGCVASAELYNPATGTFTLTGSLNTPRENHTATLLNNGMVLVAGGAGAGNVQYPNGFFGSAELYNPATGIFTLTGSLNTARGAHTATLLNNGLVLIAGGAIDVNG
jgi:plastocyanin